MKKYLILFFAFLFLCSCEDGRLYYCGTEETAEKISKFMTDNIKSANNMSDEEMEDVVHELYISAVRIYCVKKKQKDMLPNERTFHLNY